jgi:hypothetical protein
MVVIPGHRAAMNPESRDSGSGASHHPGMTEKHESAISRHECVRVIQSNHPRKTKRAQGMPDARCTRGRLCRKKHRRQQPGVHRINRHSLRNGFNGFLRALSGDHAWLPPSSARHLSVFANLAPASERQDHTTSPYVAASFVRAIIAPDAAASIASRSQRP